MFYQKMKVIVLMFFMVCSANVFSADTKVVSVTRDGSGSVKEGEFVEYKIQVADLVNFHTIFFDLQYDADLLEFNSFKDQSASLKILNNESEGKFLYAVREDRGKIVVSFSLLGKETLTVEGTVTIATVRFKVRRPLISKDSFVLSFDEKGVWNTTTELEGVTWTNSVATKILKTENSDFINIVSPLGKIQYLDDIDILPIQLVFSKGSGYKYEISLNDTVAYFAQGSENVSKISNSSGYAVISSPLMTLVNGSLVSLDMNVGQNVLSVKLFDYEDKEIVSNQVYLYKVDEKTKIKLIAPRDHQIVSDSIIRVEVLAQANSLADVNVNGKVADDMVSGDNGFNRFFFNVALKKGFNEIVAQLKFSLEGNEVIASDSISVYCESDSSVFNIVRPFADSVIKTQSFVKDNSSNFEIVGEINSRYIEGKSGFFGIGAQDNVVSVSAVYESDYGVVIDLLDTDNNPDNVDYVIADITKASDPFVGSKYQFKVSTRIKDPSRLSNGRIVITAYKNYKDGKYDAKAERVVYVSDSPLKIELSQPNVFQDELYNSKDVFKSFNANLDPFSVSDVEFKDGSLILKKDNTAVADIDYFSDPENKVVSVVTTPDGTNYIIGNNTSAKTLFILKQNEVSGWDVVLDRKDISGIYVYSAVVGSRLGDNRILLGCSNLYNADKSGLYIYDGNVNQVYNVRLGATVYRNIEFVDISGSSVSLFGSYFSHLLKFSLNDLVKADSADFFTVGLVENNISAPVYDKIDNCWFVDDSKLVIVKKSKNLDFYRLSSDGQSYNLEKSIVEKANESYKVVVGDYSTGEYIAILVYGFEDGRVETFMYNKVNSNLGLISSSISAESLRKKVDGISL
ncbi:MAG: hypothetical protein JXR63_05880, partial [Spirochaetales bacterium]|nr:hypothetical protein [Spirochaetales bacterium]